MNICRHSGSCGGCIYQEIPYQEQIEMKAKYVFDLLKEKGIFFDHFLGVQASPKRYGYRNKMEYTFGDETKGGEMTLGLHKQGSYLSVVSADGCLIADPDFSLILAAVLKFCKEKGYSFYKKKTHIGLLRNLVLRKGERTRELLVNIVTSSQNEFDDQAFVSLIEGLVLQNEVVGILRTVNDKKSDAVIHDSLKVLKGRDYYNEIVLGLRFQVSAFSFFQPNVLASEIMYSEALSLIDDLKGKTVFDLYSGTGTISQLAACRAEKVIGIEILEEAVLSAKENAELNGLSNCEFISGDVLKTLEKIKAKPDVIIMDPPRFGVHPKALQKILDYGVNEILYISCNPRSMADNIEIALEQGYRTDCVKVYDNFPFTKHIECVILMQRSGLKDKK